MFIKKIFANLQEKISGAISTLTITQRVIFTIALSGVIVGTLGLLFNVSQYLSLRQPMRGGYIEEGLVGYPRFMNPVLASTNTDKSITNLVYSSLVKEGNYGEIIYDLAEEISISADRKIYTIKIKDNAYFHDGAKLTTSDVAFTISLIQNSQTKSPLSSRFQGVSISIIDDYQMVFTLAQPYSNFLKNLTVGILPKHIWANFKPDQISYAEYNLKPIGSGPFKYDKSRLSRSGVPVFIELDNFKKYHNDKAFLNGYKFVFFETTNDAVKALSKKRIDTFSSFYTEELLNAETNFETKVSVPRFFGLFINNGRSSIINDNQNVKRAINLWLDRQQIIDTVLNGYGQEISKAVPANFLKSGSDSSPTAGISEEPQQQARQLLELDGWRLNTETGYLEKNDQTLEINLASGNSPELTKVSQEIENQLKNLGVKININYYSLTELEQNIIPTRNYEMLLFGQILQTETDLYAFWHSTQTINPGINITNYQNSQVDEWLEDTLTEGDEQARIELFEKISSQLENDLPIIFLYSPNYIIKSHKDIKGKNLEFITDPDKRFYNIYSWYLYQDYVWR